MMGRIEGIRRFFRLPSNEGTVERDVEEELAFHVETRVEELMLLGLGAREARAQALQEFGDLPSARSELAEIDRARFRRVRRALFVDAAGQDVRHALRAFAREPGFASAVVLTLALGIGLNAAMFGITDRLLFRPPAYVVAADQVKRIFFTETTSYAGVVSQRATTFIDYEALRKSVPAFTNAGAYFETDVSLGRGQDAQKVRWSLASASFFTTLGVRPHLGRFYTESEDQVGKAETVTVLSYPFWQRHFGGEESALGRTLELGSQKYTVIGVAPRGFTGVELEGVDLFVPIAAAAPPNYGDGWDNTRSMRWLRVVARLRPDASTAAATEQATAIYRSNVPSRAADRGAARASAESIILAKGPPEFSTSASNTARIALWLSGVSLMVLLIACANIMNLLLGRVARRQREIGIRMALGVGRGRLVGHFMIETVILALAGGLVGLALANWGGALVRNLLLPAYDWSAGVIDLRVLLYTAALILLCGVIAGSAPALYSLRTNLINVLKSGAREGTYRSRTRMALVVVQTTLSVVLLIGAGLFVRSLLNLRQMPKGFDPQNVLAMSWQGGGLDLSGEEWNRLYHEAAVRVKQLPLVQNAAVGMAVPFWSSISTDLRVEGWDSLPRVKDGGPFYNGVTPDYFRTVGTRIVSGRAFAEADRMGAPRVAIVSQTMGRILWPNQSPLGKCLYVGADDDQPPCSRVVGVAEDALRQSLKAEVMQYYVPLDQLKPRAFRTLFVRTRGDRHAAVLQIRHAVQRLNPQLPFADMRFLAELMDPETRPWRLGAALFSAFGLLALLIAAIGLYSVIAYNVAQRTQEMSVRIALGARTRHVLGLVVGDVARVVIAGMALGVGAAWFAANRAAPLLFDVSPRDPKVFSGVVGVLLAVAVMAALAPAARALRIQPVNVLRDE